MGFMGTASTTPRPCAAPATAASPDTAVDIAARVRRHHLRRRTMHVLGARIMRDAAPTANTIKYIKTTATPNLATYSPKRVASAFPLFSFAHDRPATAAGRKPTPSPAPRSPWDNALTRSSCAEPKTRDAKSIVSFMLWLGPTTCLRHPHPRRDVPSSSALHGGGSALRAANRSQQIALFAAVFQSGWFVESM